MSISAFIPCFLHLSFPFLFIVMTTLSFPAIFSFFFVYRTSLEDKPRVASVHGEHGVGLWLCIHFLLYI